MLLMPSQRGKLSSCPSGRDSSSPRNVAPRPGQAATGRAVNISHHDGLNWKTYRVATDTWAMGAMLGVEPGGRAALNRAVAGDIR